MSDSPAQLPHSTGGLHLKQFRGAAMLLMFSIFAGRGIGYLREAYIAWYFGAGRNTDAYNVAFTIPDLLSYLVAGGALSITFIPILDSLREAGRESENNRIMSIVATFMSAILITGTLICEYFAPGILRWYQPSFTPGEFQECLFMTRILLACPLFMCLGGLCSARLYTKGAFLIPSIMPLVYSFGTLAGGVILGPSMGVAGLAVGTVAGAVVGMFLLPLMGAMKHGIRLRPYLDLSDPYFRKWLKTTVPLMLGVSIVTADDFFIRYFAGRTAGAISLLNYAKRLTGVPIAVLGQAIGQAAMPFFSNLANQGNWNLFRETVDRSVTRMVLAGIFAISLLEALSLSAVRMVYERGRFSDADAHLAAMYFAIFMVTLVFWISQGIYARAFYATGNTLAPMLQSTLVSALTLPVYWILMRQSGIVGLAEASDVAIVIQTITLAWLLQRRGLLYLDRGRWLEICRAALAGVLAWAVAATMMKWIEPATYYWLHETGVVVVVTAVWFAAVVILIRLLRLRSAASEATAILKKLRLA